MGKKSIEDQKMDAMLKCLKEITLAASECYMTLHDLREGERGTNAVHREYQRSGDD